MTQTIATQTSTATKNLGEAATWTIDQTHTSVGFGVRHMMVSTIRGELQKVSGTVTWDPAAPEKTEIDVEIEVASINTREATRDAHLRSADFFDADTHPKITFVSRGAGRRKNGRIEVTGDLTIRGTTRPVTLEVEGPTPVFADPWGKLRTGASAKTSIKRSDFGMTWNTVLEAGGLLVGDEIAIQLDVQLTRAK